MPDRRKTSRPQAVVDQRERWMREHVDSQPPLTTKQRDALQAILGPFLATTAVMVRSAA